MTPMRHWRTLALLFAALIVAAGSPAVSLADGDREPNGDKASARQLAAGFHLRGVLVSNGGRSALVNGDISREGDRVAGLEIIEIHEDGVRVMAAGETLNIPVGARAEAGVIRRSNIMITRNRGTRPVENRPMADSADMQVTLAKTESQNRQRQVLRGETLADIAADYVGDDLSLDQVMAGLFRVNGKAFGGNINLLFADARLKIPSNDELRNLSATEARGQVQAHMQRWRGDRGAPIQVANQPAPATYGPVQPGDTLSAIAARLDLDGVTQDQAMMALFAANPNAFSGNINRLLAGKTLTVPDETGLSRTSPELAAAEVQRHLSAWNNGTALITELAANSTMDARAPPGERLLPRF